MTKKRKPRGRGHQVRTHIGLVLYLVGGWRTYRQIGEEFGWSIVGGMGSTHCKTAKRNVDNLEEAGLPVLRRPLEDDGRTLQVRLSTDWVARTPWLRRYILREQPIGPRVV